MKTLSETLNESFSDIKFELTGRKHYIDALQINPNVKTIHISDVSNNAIQLYYNSNKLNANDAEKLLQQIENSTGFSRKYEYVSHHPEKWIRNRIEAHNIENGVKLIYSQFRNDKQFGSMRKELTSILKKSNLLK